MQCTTGMTDRQWRWGVDAHRIAVLGLVVLAATGMTVESSGGWVACPPQVIVLEWERHREGRRHECRCGFAWGAGWAWMRRSWIVAAVRSEALLVLVCLTERQEWE